MCKRKKKKGKKYGGFILALFISACHKVRIIKKI
jgi:hypothetical protein